MSAHTPASDADLLPAPLQRKPEDHFKMFPADTALSAAVGATRCRLEYFCPDKVVFASDFPFDAEGGCYLVRETIKALDALGQPGAIRRQTDVGDISKLIGRKRDWAQ